MSPLSTLKPNLDAESACSFVENSRQSCLQRDVLALRTPTYSENNRGFIAWPTIVTKIFIQLTSEDKRFFGQVKLHLYVSSNLPLLNTVNGRQTVENYYEQIFVSYILNSKCRLKTSLS